MIKSIKGRINKVKKNVVLQLRQYARVGRIRSGYPEMKAEVPIENFIYGMTGEVVKSPEN
jgi:hypothetical protein